jgi:hypothetical protein
MNQRQLAILVATLAGSQAYVASAADEDSLMRRLTLQFEHSDIEFQRAASNIPFLPVAFLGASYYGDSEIDGSNLRDQKDYQYDVTTVSQAAGLPLLLTERDALVVGEYVSIADIDVTSDDTSGNTTSFTVGTLGLPVAWLRQINPDWQSVAFVMPMGHRDDRHGSQWSWQYLGGAFGRYVQNDRLWWAFGFYADVGPGDDFYIPYIGASWSINERWTLSAVMPWPAVLYAPDKDWLFRLGASPSGASWSFNPVRGSDTAINFDAWDFGLGVERRLGGNFWLAFEAGVGGFRGLRVTGTDVDSPSLDVSTAPYVAIDVKFRPSIEFGGRRHSRN